MLNSKFAPIVALTVLLVLVIMGLGYMFGFKPSSEQARDLINRESAVRANIKKIEEDVDFIKTAESKLSEVEDVTPLIETNAPTTDGVREFQQLVTNAIDATGNEVVEFNVTGTGSIDGWTVSSAVRPSTVVASHFATAPLPRQPGDLNSSKPYTPVVTAPAEGQPVTDALGFITVEIKVKGTAPEAVAFLAALQRPEDRLFLVAQIVTEAKSSQDPQLEGVSPFADGDQVTTITGNLYIYNFSGEIDDEEGTNQYTLPPVSPFEYPEPLDPQPGADN